ncbi:hypothetical protein [Catellatospora citrea]|uniref:Uncharacterized protein n=1 Tax=Catellatospora citrea TaxID=53366 RepID=A0A8J3KTN0_9ACTN|nr:hypothetical protein [Catellatospora citrea]RKE00307.1 hypothetical protein C8E86_8365 [Catellatospora citrea]RKE13005.1 hypothetical protein C8E86_7950 [Catellatospora citrea]GIG03219.1 hypothetical protein Cci01nite_83120 [Catellatospora citrea]
MAPPTPVKPGDPAETCRGKRLNVTFTVRLDDAGNVIGQPTATAQDPDEQPQP